MAFVEEVFIMHECQESSLCGQHCLNNLLQQSVYDAVALSTIAQELDQMELDCMKEENPSYVPPSGMKSGPSTSLTPFHL